MARLAPHIEIPPADRAFVRNIEVKDEKINLAQRYLDFNPPGRSLISLYNDWIIRQLPVQIRSRKLYRDNGVIEFSQVELSPPTTNEDGKTTILTPMMARNRGLVYKTDIEVTARFNFKPTVAFFIEGTESQTNVPVDVTVDYKDDTAYKSLIPLVLSDDNVTIAGRILTLDDNKTEINCSVTIKYEANKTLQYVGTISINLRNDENGPVLVFGTDPNTYDVALEEKDNDYVGSVQLFVQTSSIDFKRPPIVRVGTATITTRFEQVDITEAKSRELRPLEKKFKMCEFPVMVGSQLCHLYNKNDAELVSMGECPSDPQGYFIIKGTERLIITQEKLRLSKIIIYVNIDGTIICQYTCPVPVGTIMVTLALGKKYGQIKVGLNHLGRSERKKIRHLPLFLVFALMGVSVDEAKEMINDFVEEPNQTAVEYILKSSYFKADSIMEFDTGDSDEKLERAINYVATKRKLPIVDRKVSDVSRKDILNNVHNDLFPTITYNTAHMPSDMAVVNEETIRKQIKVEKCRHLAMMTAVFCRYLCKLRPADSRDSSGNKRYTSAAKEIQHLFGSKWRTAIVNVQRNITTISNFESDTQGLISECNKRFTEDFRRNFTSNAWGDIEAKSKENIVDALKRMTPMDAISHITRIGVGANRRNKQVALRVVQASGLGMVCPAETPEGEQCGRTKNFALSCSLSIDHDFTTVWDAISRTINETKQQLKSDARTREFPHPILLNGIIKGWCNNLKLCPILRQMRQRHYDLRDICIFANIIDNTLEIYCDASRCVRPLLTVNTKGQLIIDEKKMRDASIPELFDSGCIELVDAQEQEWILIAQSQEDAKHRYTDLEIATRHLLEQKLVTFEVIDRFENEYTDSVARGYRSKEEIKALRGNAVETKMKGRLDDIVAKPQRTDAESAELKALQTSFEELKLLFRPRYTHCEIDPIFILGLSASLMPQSNRCHGPRVTYNSSMQKQALCQYHSNIQLRFDTSFKMMKYPTRPIFEVETSRTSRMDYMPTGDTFKVAFMANKNNLEDGILLCEEAVRAGKFDLIKYTTHVQSIQGSERFGRPTYRSEEQKDRYHAIGEDGLPRIDEYIRQDDCVIGRYQYIPASDEKKETQSQNTSIFARLGEDGYVDSVMVTYNFDKDITVKVKIRQCRNQIEGDKIASRYSQKGTFARILPARLLPHVVRPLGFEGIYPNEGVVPDLIINPHSIPSRMTVSKIIEMLVSKAAMYSETGEHVDATTYREDFDIEKYRTILRNNNMDPDGLENMAWADGTPIDGKIFMGLCYYMCLKHHTIDKYKVRSRGQFKKLTHQPEQGRVKRGGIKIGEMERDAFISHGAAGIINERMLTLSNEYRTVVCIKCGMLAVAKYGKEYICQNRCTAHPEPIRVLASNREGIAQNFALITIPYVFKLLCQMLTGIGIQAYFKVKVKPQTRYRESECLWNS